MAFRPCIMPWNTAWNRWRYFAWLSSLALPVAQNVIGLLAGLVLAIIRGIEATTFMVMPWPR